MAHVAREPRVSSQGLSPDGLVAPVLLLAMPQVRDPFFQRSVVLLVAHEDDGSLGFVLNRPTDLKVEQILEDLDIPWGGDRDQPAYLR